MTSASIHVEPRPHAVRFAPVAAALALLLVTFAVTHLLSWPGSVSYFRAATGGQPTLDLKASSSARETYERLDALGADGRALYMRLILSVDVVFPMAMLLFLLMLARFAGGRAPVPAWARRALLAGPGLYFAADLLENASALAMLLRYPQRLEAIASAIGVLTISKRAFMMSAFLLPLMLLMFNGFARRRRGSPDPAK